MRTHPHRLSFDALGGGEKWSIGTLLEAVGPWHLQRGESSISVSVDRPVLRMAGSIGSVSVRVAVWTEDGDRHETVVPLVARLPVVATDGTVLWRGRTMAPQGLLRLRPGVWAPSRNRRVWVPTLGRTLVARRSSGNDWTISTLDGSHEAPRADILASQSIDSPRLVDPRTRAAARQIGHLGSSAFAGDMVSWEEWLTTPDHETARAPRRGRHLEDHQVLLAGHHLSEAVWLGIKRFSESLEPAAYLAGTGLRLADDGTRIVVSDIDVSQLCSALAAVAADTCQRAVEACMAPGAVGRAVVRNLWSEVDNDNALSIHQLTRQVSPLGESLFSDDNRSALRQRPLDPSEIGSFCLVDTPESTRCGLVRVLVPEAQISADGVITPLADPEPVDHLGASASLMPFLGSNAAARGVIGAKNLRQFVPVLGNEAPVVRTGWESRLSDAGPIEFGVNLLTAFIPWKGFNIEDGVVVSESAARRMSSELVETLVEPLAAGEFVATPLSRLRGTCLEAGEVMFDIAGAHTPRSTIAPRPLTIDDARVVVRNGERTVRITARVSRPLVVGDKVTGRHGNKGVIGAILPDTQMPELLIAGEWHPAEMLMHPIGVLRRNCLGAVMELHSGLIALETGLDHVFVGALDRPARATPEALLAALAEVGHPDGRTKCRFDDAERTPVVAGLAYTVRLHHLAERKVQSRRAAALDPLAAQPSAGRPWRNGRRRGRPQRLGEMEMWALQSWNATAILADALTTRRNAHADELAPTLVRVLQLIAAAGFEVWLDDIELSTITASPATPKDLHIRPRRLQTYENLAVAELVPRANPKKTEDPWVDSWFARPLAASYQLGRLRLPDPGQRPIINPWLFSRALQLAEMNGIDIQREGERGLDPIRLAQELIDANLLPDSWVLRAVTVPPPELLVTEFGDRRRMTPLGQRYRQLGEALDEWNPRDGARARPPQQANPQRAVIDALFGLYGPQRRSGEDGSLSGLLNGKYGLLRHGLLGTRTVNSGRGVIAPDPTLGLRSVGLPTPIWEDLRLEEGTAVVVHRPPSLQRHSLIGLIAHANRHSAAITLHPAMIGPLAGDFDGDEVSVHVPRDAAAQREVSDVLGAVRRGPAHGEALLFQSQEIGLAGAPASDFDLGWEELEGRYLLALSAGAGMCSVSIPDLRDAQRDETLAAHLIDRMSPAGFEAKHLRTCVAPVGELFVRGRAHAVTGNLLDGLITTEYSVAAANAVEAMTTKKIAVRSAGNLTKRLVEALYDVTITASTCAIDGPSDLEHCRLISRRSCCADCYGVNPATGRAVDVGTAVGLLAAQSIGERGTQLALKAIHAGTKQVNLRSVEQALSKGGPGALEAMIAAYPDIADVHLRLAVAVLALGPGTESRLDEAIATQPPFARALERGRVDFIIDAMASADDCTLTVTFDHPKERLAAGIGGI